jgi:hypothetical protein
MAISLPADFSEFLRLLRSHGVEYLVVGGYAVNHYGYPRSTADLDVWIAATRENAERCLAALYEYGFRDSSLTPDIFLNPKTLIRLGVPPLRLELLTSISGAEFSQCYPRRQRVDWNGVMVDLISRADLEANKRASGRSKDLNDLEHLSDSP